MHFGCRPLSACKCRLFGSFNLAPSPVSWERAASERAVKKKEMRRKDDISVRADASVPGNGRQATAQSAQSV